MLPERRIEICWAFFSLEGRKRGNYIQNVRSKKKKKKQDERKEEGNSCCCYHYYSHLPPTLLCGLNMTQYLKRLSCWFSSSWKNSRNDLEALCIFYALKIGSDWQVCDFSAQPLITVKGHAGLHQTANKLKQTAGEECTHTRTHTYFQRNRWRDTAPADGRKQRISERWPHFVK